MARALRAWAINQGGENSVRNLWYGPRTRLVRGIYTTINTNCAREDFPLPGNPLTRMSSFWWMVGMNGIAEPNAGLTVAVGTVKEKIFIQQKETCAISCGWYAIHIIVTYCR